MVLHFDEHETLHKAIYCTVCKNNVSYCVCFCFKMNCIKVQPKIQLVLIPIFYFEMYLKRVHYVYAVYIHNKSKTVLY